LAFDEWEREIMGSVTTIGNATMVVRDGGVILVTDPWMGEEDHAYSGSCGSAFYAAAKRAYYTVVK
jgi:hypothetical protein